MSAGLLETTVRARVWLSLTEPELIPVRATIWAPASSTIVRSFRTSSVGGWLPALTFTTKESLAISPEPSDTVRLTMAEPNWLSAGVTLTVRLAPLPPRAMLAVGTKVGLDEIAATARPLADVSTSPTVNGSKAVVLFWEIDWLVMSDIVGASFTALTVTAKVRMTVLFND